MQTILGSGGAIGVELAKELTKYTNEIRLVSRNPLAVNPSDQTLSADLTISEDVNSAVEGSEIVYLTVGLPYKLSVWKKYWPIIMQNVINACRIHHAKLVFFDNVYMYDPEHMNLMTEDTPMAPTSQKGRIRKNVAQMLMDEIQKGTLQALIARSADFYGPNADNSSILTQMVAKKLAGRKRALWLGDPDCRHSFTFTPDAGSATALLGNTPDAYNQVWHLPTEADPPTGKDWITAVAKTMGAEPRYRTMNSLSIRLLGIFFPVMRELAEMTYQYNRDFIFDSSKFERHFDFRATDYITGIHQVFRTEKNYESECLYKLRTC